MTYMPDVRVTPYEQVRDCILPGMVAFFSADTTGFKKVTNFASWRIKHDQTPAHECTHVGLIDHAHGRRMVVEATAPDVQVAPLSAFVCETAGPDGKWTDPYDGTIYIGEFAECDGEAATCCAWNNLMLPYDYLDLAAIRLGIKRRNLNRYVCSELVAEALLAGGVPLDEPENGWAYTPADLILSNACTILWRLR